MGQRLVLVTSTNWKKLSKALDKIMAAEWRVFYIAALARMQEWERV